MSKKEELKIDLTQIQSKAPSGWKVRYIQEHERDPNWVEHVAFMAKASRQGYEKIQPSTKQTPYTEYLLSLTEEQAAERRKQLEDPTFWMDLQEKSKAKVYTEEEMWERAYKVYGAETIDTLEALRRRPKNSLGQSTESAFSEEKKKSAQDAWTYTAPSSYTEAEKMQIAELEAKRLAKAKPEPAPIEPPKKKSFWSFLKKEKKQDPHQRMSYAELQEWRNKNET